MNVADKHRILIPIHGNKLGLDHDGRLVAPQGRVVCLTGTEYYKQCGIDPYTHAFTE